MLRVSELNGFGAGAPLEFKLVGTNTAIRAGSITMPAGIQQYDWIFYWDYTNFNSAGNSPVTPSGFTAVDFSGGSSQLINCVSLKEAAGTEGGTSIAGMSSGGSQACAKIVLVVRPNIRVKRKGSAVTTGKAFNTSSADLASFNVNSAGSHFGILMGSIGSTTGTIGFSTSGQDATLSAVDSNSWGNSRMVYAIANGGSKSMSCDPTGTQTTPASLGIWQEFEAF